MTLPCYHKSHFGSNKRTTHPSGTSFIIHPTATKEISAHWLLSVEITTAFITRSWDINSIIKMCPIAYCPVNFVCGYKIWIPGIEWGEIGGAEKQQNKGNLGSGWVVVGGMRWLPWQSDFVNLVYHLAFLASHRLSEWLDWKLQLRFCFLSFLSRLLLR